MRRNKCSIQLLRKAPYLHKYCVFLLSSLFFQIRYLRTLPVAKFMTYEWISMDHWWNDTDRGIPKSCIRRKYYPSAHLFTTNHTRTCLGSNPHFRGGCRRLTAWNNGSFIVILIIVAVIVTIIVFGGGWLLFTCSQDQRYMQVQPQIYPAFEYLFVLSHNFEPLISIFNVICLLIDVLFSMKCFDQNFVSI